MTHQKKEIRDAVSMHRESMFLKAIIDGMPLEAARVAARGPVMVTADGDIRSAA